MIKKPKRDLKVKSIYDQAGDTSTLNNQSVSTPLSEVPQPKPQPVIIQSPFVQETEAQPIPQIVEYQQIHPSFEHNQPSIILPVVQTQDVRIALKQQAHFTSKPNLIKQPETHPVVKEAQKPQVDSKKSKIQQLKQKYLKKNANVNTNIQPTNNLPRVVPQEQKKQPAIQQSIAPKIQHTQTIISPPPFIPLTKVQAPQINTKIEPNINKQQMQQIKSNNHYQTDFKPLIEERVKSKPPPPPVKRQIGNARNPFELKGTYTRPQIKQQIQQKVQPQIPTYQQNIPFSPYPQYEIKTPQLKSNQPSISKNPFDQYDKADTQTTNNPFSPSSIIPIKPIPTVTQPANLNLRYSDAISHPQSFIKDLCLVNLLSEDIFNIIQQKLYKTQSSKLYQLNTTSNHPQFNSWVSRLFTSLVIQSQTIDESNSQLVDDILNQFFLPLGQQFSPIFIVTLSKLPQKYYFKYQNYLIERSQLYINMIHQYSHLISPVKISQFLLFIQNHLNTSDPMYAENIIKTYLISPQTINEYSLNNLILNLSFPHAYVLLQILGKQKNKYIKQNLQIANIVIKQLEQNNQIEGGLELLKVLTQQLGTPAYTSLRQVRQRLISKYSQPEKVQTDTINQAKNVASNFFGFFSNAMDKIINKQPGQQQQQQQQPEKPVEKQPQAKESIYFDPIKKRYVLNGEIPDDQQEQTQVPIKQHAPPPPASRGVPPPPPVSSSNAVGNKKPNRILTNRYV